MTAHRMSYTKEYKAWRRMKDCIHNHNIAYFGKYGGRGVTICDAWEKDFFSFLRDMGNIPPDCNGLFLMQGAMEFRKETCKWIKKKVGRPQNDLPKEKKNPRKRFKKSSTICLSIEKELLDYITRLSLEQSIQAGHYIERNNLIRDALALAFPLPSQMDMFGDKIK